MLERKTDNAFPRRKGHLLDLQIKSVFSHSQPKAPFSEVSISSKRILIFDLEESQPVDLMYKQ